MADLVEAMLKELRTIYGLDDFVRELFASPKTSNEAVEKGCLGKGNKNR